MRKSQNVQERYYSALDELYGILKQVPSTRQLVAKAGGSNSTAEKYTITWCGERGIPLPTKERKKLPQDLEEAIEKEIEGRVLEACTAHTQESQRLTKENEEFRAKSEALTESVDHLRKELQTALDLNLNLLGQLTQCENYLSAAREEVESNRRSFAVTIEEFRLKTAAADERRVRAETELALIPERNKRADTDLLIADVLSRALDRETFFESLVKTSENTYARNENSGPASITS